MTLVGGYGAAIGAIFRRDLAIFLTYRFRLVSQLASVFFGVLLFYYLSRIVGGGRAFATADDYFAFAVVGLAVMQVLGATLGALPVAIRQELVAGSLERLVLSPFGAVGAVASMTIFPFVFALVNALATLALAAAAFGMPISWSTLPYAVPVAIAGAAAFAPFSLLIASSAIALKQASAGAGFVVTGISLIGGFFFPTSLLPGWLSWTAQVQPFSPALGLLRHLIAGAPLQGSLLVDVVKVVGFAVVLMPISLVVVHLAVRYAQRRGTIIEY